MKSLKIVLPLLVLPLTIACQKNNGFNTISLSSTDSASVQSIEGGLKLQFVNPTAASTIPADLFKVSINVEPINKLESLRLIINDREVKAFSRLPFEMTVDPSTYYGAMVLKAEAKDLSGKVTTISLTLGSPITPGTDPASSKSAGTFDTNCMNNNSFDACIFWKNPVAQNGAAFSHKVQFGDNLSSTQTFGVKLRGLASVNSLSNSSFQIIASGGQTAAPVNGSWKFPYESDSGRFNAQLMAYFWLNYQESEMIKRSGRFFAGKKGIQVDAYSTAVKDNAYWDGSRVVMGYASTGGSPAHEMALGSEVYLHELGHANLQFAVGGYSAISPNPSLQVGHNCTSAAGCIGGINEGQADFHFLMVFLDSTPLGETWVNSANGLSGRDVKKNLGLTASQAFGSSNGEVHTMGALYAAALWAIYTNPAVTKLEFEKIFTQHLTMLTGSSRFSEAKDALIASDLALYSGKYKSVIANAFTQRGM